MTNSIARTSLVIAGGALLLVALFGVGCIEDAGGGSWESVEQPGDNIVIKSIEFYDDQRGWMAAEGATGVDDKGAWFTDDGGETWELVYSPYSAYVVKYDASGEQAWMGGSDSRQLWVAEDGQNFEPRAEGFVQHDLISDLHFWGDGTGVAVTETSDRIHRTTDGGEDFELIEMQRETLAGTNDLGAHGDQVWLASGQDFTSDASGARLLHSDDRGSTWDVIELEDRAHNHEGGSLEAVHVVDENEIWAAGLNRQLYFTTDGMETWDQVSNVPDSVDNFYAVDGHGDHIIASGSTNTADDGFVFSSEDGGQSWEMMEFAPEACHQGCTIQGLEYVHEDLAYAYGPNGTLLRLGSP